VDAEPVDQRAERLFAVRVAVALPTLRVPVEGVEPERVRALAADVAEAVNGTQ
jgi:hypothetical protein